MPTRPDVLLLSPHLAPPAGGVQRLAINMADAFAAQEVRVVGVSEADSSDPRVRVVRQRSGRLGGLRTTYRYTAAVFAELRRRPRAIVGMTWRAALPAVLVPRRGPLALYCHGGELLRAKGGRVEVMLRRIVLRRATTIGANSQFTRSLVHDVCGRDAVVIHPPIGHLPEGDFTRPDSGTMHVLSVGRLVPNKGHDRLLRAVARARSQGAAIDLTIVGSGPDAASLAALAATLGLDSVITFAGGVSDVELDALYRRADVFALLSTPVGGEVEGFGIVFLEANSYELPVIAGRSGGSTEAVEDAVSGIVVDSEDEAAAALIALASDAERRHALGVGGRARLHQFAFAAFAASIRAWVR